MKRIIEQKIVNRYPFYPDGKLKSIYLERQQDVSTTVGMVKAEYITYYSSGKISRIFPVYGQISGFWSEEDEEKFLPVSEIEIKGQWIISKISCFSFYETGELKSITLWPKEQIMIHRPEGNVLTRIGISFYRDGSIKSLEPAVPVAVTVRNCRFMAFDNDPIGVHGDNNSLQYDIFGNVSALKTISTSITISRGKERYKISPEKKVSMLDLEQMVTVPISLELQNNTVTIVDSSNIMHQCDLNEYSMKTYESLACNSDEALKSCSNSCSNCDKCIL